MLKPFEEILKIDRRHMQGGPYAALIDNPMEALYSDVVHLELHGLVPDEVRIQFDTARYSFIYSWFCYELLTLAEQQCYSALENGLRIRAEQANALPKRRGMKALIDNACDCGWLNKPDFIRNGMNFLDAVSIARNHVSHGIPSVSLQFSLMIIEQCSDVLNKLFPETVTSDKR